MIWSKTHRHSLCLFRCL